MAQRNLHKRIKHHQMPGDISKKYKIAMREGKDVVLDYGNGIIDIRPASRTKAFRKDITKRERAVVKRRAQKEVDLEVE